MAQKSFRAQHLELRHKTYYAVLTVPTDVRLILGKKKFFKTTGTSNLRLAQTKAELFVIQWQSEIANARQDSSSPVLHSALELNKIRNSTPKVLFDEVLEDEANRLEQETNEIVADIFKEVAKGNERVLTSYIDGWENHQHARNLTKKNIDQMKRDLSLLTDDIPTTRLLSKPVCSNWIKNLASTRSLSASSVTRIISASNNFYKYLQHVGVVDEDEVSPFKVPKAYQVSDSKNGKSIFKKNPWRPFSREQVEQLYEVALRKGDQELADLIVLAAYTGARIEELCSLKIEMVNLVDLTISINDAKTEAGIRTVPIHPNVQNLFERLKTSSSDGYILCNLAKSKYGVRSNAIGKRFGRLKKALGHGKQHVFHSIRKTFTTLLHQADVTEVVAANIVGHEIKTMTYGVYSEGSSIEQKRSAIANVRFNFDS
jgi:integrase